MIIKELKELNAKNILSLVSEEEIYKYYLPDNFKFNVPFSSPFRLDKIPSFIIGGKNRNYRFKDFATGESGNCFNFVMKLYNINFNSALIQIINDLSIKDKFIVNTENYKINNKKAEYKNPGKTLNIGEISLKIKRRDFEDYDYNYWNSYGISPNYLKYGRIVAISHYFINDIMYIAEKYAYAYIEKKDGKITYKVYQPFSKYKKWINNNNYSIWELWHLLPELNDILVITSSRKDALSIIENLRIPAVALQAESVIPKEVVIKEILRRFKKVYLLYDNDYNKEENWGQKMAEKIISKYPEISNLVIDEKYLSKDYSDLTFNLGRIKAKEILKNMIT